MAFAEELVLPPSAAADRIEAVLREFAASRGFTLQRGDSPWNTSETHAGAHQIALLTDEAGAVLVEYRPVQDLPVLEDLGEPLSRALGCGVTLESWHDGWQQRRLEQAWGGATFSKRDVNRHWADADSDAKVVWLFDPLPAAAVPDAFAQQVFAAIARPEPALLKEGLHALGARFSNLRAGGPWLSVTVTVGDEPREVQFKCARQDDVEAVAFAAAFEARSSFEYEPLPEELEARAVPVAEHLSRQVAEAFGEGAVVRLERRGLFFGTGCKFTATLTLGDDTETTTFWHEVAEDGTAAVDASLVECAVANLREAARERAQEAFDARHWETVRAVLALSDGKDFELSAARWRQAYPEFTPEKAREKVKQLVALLGTDAAES